MPYLNPEYTEDVGPIAAIEFNLGRNLSDSIRESLAASFRDDAVAAIRDWAAEAMDGRPSGEAHAVMERRIGEHLAAVREIRSASAGGYGATGGLR